MNDNSNSIHLDVDTIPQADIEHIKAYINNHPSDRILLSSLPSNLKRKYTKEQYLPVLQQLAAEGHGTVASTENSTGPKATVFIKRKRSELVTNLQLPTTSIEFNPNVQMPSTSTDIP